MLDVPNLSYDEIFGSDLSQKTRQELMDIRRAILQYGRMQNIDTSYFNRLRSANSFQSTVARFQTNFPSDKFDIALTMAKRLDEIDLEMARRANAERPYDKFKFIANVRDLAKYRDIKLGDIEEASGVAPGYLSRIDKESNSSEPPLSLAVTAAHILRTTVDALLFQDCSGLTPNEQYLLSFITKLRKDTEADKLSWNCEKANVLNHMEVDPCNCQINHSLFDYKETLMNSGCEYPDTVLRGVMCSNAYGDDTWIAGDCFNMEMGPSSTLYIMNVQHSRENRPNVIELWIYKDREATFLTSSNDPAIGKAITNFYNALSEHMQHPTLHKDIKSLIDNFLLSD